VTRLAAKHGIAVTLRRSPFGGVTAVVLLPPELVAAEADAIAITSSSAPGGTRMLTAAPAGSPAASPSPPAEPSVVDASATDPKAVSGGTETMATPAVPRQRTLTVVPSPPPASTVRGVTPEGLPQRVRPSGRGDHAVRIASPPAPDDVVADSPATTAPVRTDDDATIGEAPRTPERMRTMLTSFQDGTALGRRRRAAADAVPGAAVTAAPPAADPAAAAGPADTNASRTNTGSTNSGTTNGSTTNTSGTDTGEAGGSDR
jgi:hypothetical protein